MAFSEYGPSLHFTSCYNLLNFLRSIFTATWVFFAASVNLMLRACSCASVLSLGQVFFSQWSDFLMTSTSCICWSYIPCRGMVFHNFFSPSSSSSQSVFCCLRHYCSSSSQGTIFLMYLWMLLVSSWIMALRRTNPHPPSYHYLYSLRGYIGICTHMYVYMVFSSVHHLYFKWESICRRSARIKGLGFFFKFWHKPFINCSHFYPCPLFSEAIYSL